MEAAYRLFDNDQVSFDNILQPHHEATRRRIGGQPVVILAQDTTEIDLTRPEQQVRGAGPIDGGRRRGALLHALHAFPTTPLGRPPRRALDPRRISSAAPNVDASGAPGHATGGERELSLGGGVASSP